MTLIFTLMLKFTPIRPASIKLFFFALGIIYHISEYIHIIYLLRRKEKMISKLQEKNEKSRKVLYETAKNMAHNLIIDNILTQPLPRIKELLASYAENYKKINEFIDMSAEDTIDWYNDHRQLIPDSAIKRDAKIISDSILSHFLTEMCE